MNRTQTLKYLFKLFIDIITKRSKIVLDASESRRLIINGFFGVNTKNKTTYVDPKYFNLNTTGIWKIDISLGEESVPVLTRNFLVIPVDNPFDSTEISAIHLWSEMFAKFWTVSSMCFKNKEQLRSDLGDSFVENKFIDDCEGGLAYWSSFYPDPKSEFKKFDYFNNVCDRISK